jgi:CBS domain-containing protein
MKALELLRAHVVKIPPGASMRDMADMLDLYQVLLLPVVDEDDRLVGAVYEDQVISTILAAFPRPGADLSEHSVPDAQAIDTSAADIMLAPPVVVDEQDDAFTALTLMTDTGLPRLPVISDGRVIGTISRVDICQALLEGEL